MRKVTIVIALLFSALLVSCRDDRPDTATRHSDPLKRDKYLKKGILVTQPAQQSSGLIGKFVPDEPGPTEYIPLCRQMYDVAALYRNPRHVESVNARYRDSAGYQDCFMLENIYYSSGSEPEP
jgi:hypothetical protein